MTIDTRISPAHWHRNDEVVAVGTQALPNDLLRTTPAQAGPLVVRRQLGAVATELYEALLEAVVTLKLRFVAAA
jgi:hypothetical protein